MDSVKQSNAAIRLARTFAKVLSFRDDKTRKIDQRTKDFFNKYPVLDEPAPLAAEAVQEAFLAQLFAAISAVKAAYAELQFAQSPYDTDGIQSADQMLISELKNLSELKQCFFKKQLDTTSPEKTLVLAEIKEQKSLLVTYEIMSKKLDSQLKLKESEIMFLQEKLADVKTDNELLEKRLKASGQLGLPEDINLSSLSISHFVTCYKQTVKSVRGFVRLLIGEMESSGWDLGAAAGSIKPGVVFWKQNHKCFVFESFVCKEIFDGFDCPNFSIQKESSVKKNDRRRLFFDRFMELKSVRPTDCLAWRPKSTFAMFCREKYSRLIHPKMEEALFDDLDQRNLVDSGEWPETPFLLAFTEMAKRVWLLHCLALSFDCEVSIFQVSKGARFNEVFMESLSDEAFLLSDSTPETDPRVAFTVVPGFRIGNTVVQCQVYLLNPTCT